MFPLLKYSEEEVNGYIAKVAPEMVDASLAKERHDWFDLLNLISPAAAARREKMREKARLARLRYYGKTVSVYAPLYIGNTCVNSCRYCDFRIQHKGTVRRNLTLDEIREEGEAIKKGGIDSLLIVAG
ncbi:MAG: 2-iminoacetate synthase ThiH, partial [Kiritimatiellae bacterium]|nr:2-iminoacetate synthase ThiH [Kiritimatiellia bacterium]